MTGPTPTTVTPDRNLLAELWHRFSNTQIPLGSAEYGLGVDVNDILGRIGDNRASDRPLPETFSVNDLIGAISKAPQSADVGRMAMDQVEAQHTAPDPNEPYGAIKHLIKLLPMSITFGGGATAPAVSRGSTTVGTYAGRNSATADLKALSKAKRLEKAGGNAAPDGDIRQQTGWFKDPSGDWMYEISDEGSAVFPHPTDPDRLQFHHPKLEAAYPGSTNMPIHKLNTDAEGLGWYQNPGVTSSGPEAGIRGNLTMAEQRSVALHEIGAHHVQDREGFAKGSSPDRAGNRRYEALQVIDELADWEDIAPYIRNAGGDLYAAQAAYAAERGQQGPFTRMYMNRLNDIYANKTPEELEVLHQRHKPWAMTDGPFHAYQSTLGEYAARDVQHRADFNDHQRRTIPPFSSETAPPGGWIDTRGPGDKRPKRMMMADEPPPLDMSPEARAARAALQGYNLDAYHGTHSDFPAFETQRSLNRQNPDAFIHVGDMEAANGALWGHHGRQYWENEAANAPDPKRREEAQREIDYHYRDAHIMPLKVKAQNPLDMPDLGRWDSHMNFMSYAAKEKGWGQGYEPKGWNPSPEIWGDFNALVDRVRKLDYGEQKAAWQQGFADILTKHGHDSVRYENHAEGSGGHSYLLLDPSQARSRFAEFHPDKVGDPNILSGRAGAPVTPNTPPPGTDPERESRDAANRAWLMMGGT